MQKMTSAFILAATLIMPFALTAPAGAEIYYPWCAQYGAGGDGGRNCGFSTLEQCQATVSGIGGFCERNSFYTGPAQRPVKRARKPRDNG
jgi:hypothetical protein